MRLISLLVLRCPLLWWLLQAQRCSETPLFEPLPQASQRRAPPAFQHSWRIPIVSKVRLWRLLKRQSSLHLASSWSFFRCCKMSTADFSSWIWRMKSISVWNAVLAAIASASETAFFLKNFPSKSDFKVGEYLQFSNLESDKSRWR